LIDREEHADMQTRRDLLGRSGAILAGGALAGCTARPPGETGPSVETAGSSLDRTRPDVREEALDALVRGQTAFALDLLARLAERDRSANRFFSPFSVSLALGMVWAGAGSETTEEMAEALRIGLPQEQYHPAVDALDRRLEDSAESATEAGDYRLSTVNALWGQEGYPFREAFLDTLATNYGAGINLVDFRDDPGAARTTINEAVAAWTEGRITDLLAPGTVTTDTRFVLTDAIYFAADWASEFDPDRTSEGEFDALDGRTQRVRMMHQTERLPSGAVDGHRLVELPYVGETTSMVVLVPARGAFDAVERDLTPDRLAALVGSLRERETAVTLPRFTFRSRFRLKPVLSALGMARAFTPEADFGGIVDPSAVDEPLYLTAAVHEAYVSVDETGTEAAAASGFGGGADSAGGPFEVAADRPFLVFVRDRETDSVLLSGRTVDAAAAQSR
jgi:serpin B